MTARLTFLAVAAATTLLSSPVRAADDVCYYWARVAESHYGGAPQGLFAKPRLVGRTMNIAHAAC